MVKGQQRQSFDEKQFYVGLALVKVVAFNPTRDELNKLLGKEAKDDDKEIEYLSEYEGDPRLRCSFWLKEESGKLFNYSFNLLSKDKKNKDGSKWQFVNSTCSTSWDESEEGDNLPDWFTKFIDNKSKEELGNKVFRKAIVGEEELVTFVRAWLGKLNFTHPDTEVLIDLKSLFKEKYKGIQEQIDGDYDDSFIILLGVRTVEPDTEDGEVKQYQAIFGKSFLQGNMWKSIKENNFKTDYTRKTWEKFQKAVVDEYGFKAFTKIEPLSVYNRDEDLAASNEAKKAEVTDDNDGY